MNRAPAQKTKDKATSAKTCFHRLLFVMKYSSVYGQVCYSFEVESFCETVQLWCRLDR